MVTSSALGPRCAVVTVVALVAFAANSLLCRRGLTDAEGSAMLFAVVRLASGAVALTCVTAARQASPHHSWRSAIWLAAYALTFANAYESLGAGVGAFVLFGTVNVTMLGAAWLRGQRHGGIDIVSAGLGVIGVGLLGGSRLALPSCTGVAWMVAAGIAWSMYSLAPRDGELLPSLACDFRRAAALALPFTVVGSSTVAFSWSLFALAVLSGAVASAVGYVAWAWVLPLLGPRRAALVQLTVPAIAASIGVIVLGERVSPQLVSGAALVLSAVAIPTLTKGTA